MTRALVVDTVDVPLGAAERTVAIAAADAVLRGLGERALAHPRAKLWIEAEREEVAAALDGAGQRLSAVVARRASTRAITNDTLRLRPSALAETAWAARGVEHRVTTVAGAVGTARVFVAPPRMTVGEIVGRAAPSSRAWVALWGGAQGRIADRDEAVGELIEDDAARLLLVLPAGHALARRARLPLSTWLRRAQSACASCAICAAACPQSIAVPELLRIVAAGRAARSTTRLAAAVDCTACGACDLACPQAISPARIVDDLARRLRVGEVKAPARRRTIGRPLDPETAARRLGLWRYVQDVPAELVPLS